MTTQLEELYLEAEADIKNNNYAEAFKKYETILYEEPGNGPTLNSLGWLYKTVSYTHLTLPTNREV